MGLVRRAWLLPVLWTALLAQEAPEEARPTAVYTLADHHTMRRAPERDPMSKITEVCRITPVDSSYTLTCSGPPADADRTGRQHFYTVALFSDLDQNLYMAACSARTRRSVCQDVRAGMTFSAEVDDQTIRIVVRGEQLPMRILERRLRPVTIDSPTQGTPSQVKPSEGTPSKVPWSQAPESRGTPSDVRPSEVSIAAGSPSKTPPSDVSVAATSPSGGRIYVYCSVGSARISIDNHVIGPPPVDAPVLPGRHTVRVRAPGMRDWVRTVEVPGGSTVKLTAELQR